MFGFAPAAEAPPARGGGKGFGGGKGAKGAKGGGHRANESPQGAPKKAKKDKDRLRCMGWLGVGWAGGAGNSKQL